MMGPTDPHSLSAPLFGHLGTGLADDQASPEVLCKHVQTKSVKTFNGNFLTLRTVCESCGRVVAEENILMGQDRFRCPVDPRLVRCFISCPVEDGSVSVFESPCEPVWDAMEATGLIAFRPARLLSQAP